MSEDFSWQVEDEPDRTIPEEKIVRGRLADLKTEHVVPNDPSKEPFTKLVWWFEVTEDGLYFGRKIKGQTSAKLSNHPNNRFRQYAEALLRQELGVNTAISRSDLLGLPCEFTVRHEKDRKDPNKIWERVDEVLPLYSAQSDTPPF